MLKLKIHIRILYTAYANRILSTAPPKPTGRWGRERQRGKKRREVLAKESERETQFLECYVAALIGGSLNWGSRAERGRELRPECLVVSGCEDYRYIKEDYIPYYG